MVFAGCLGFAFDWLFTYLILLYLGCAFGRYYFEFVSFDLLLWVFVFGDCVGCG